MFIMVDGIDGSGKGTILKAWKENLLKNNKSIFDLKKYWQENDGKYPDVSELEPYKFIFTCEPTYSSTGKIIREKLIKNGSKSSGEDIAKAYASDRLMLYEKIIIPLLAKGKTIIQDRGISTSLCYQTIQQEPIDLKYLKNLPGNILALKHRPDYLILTKIKAKEALSRLAGRNDKKDDSVFEKLNFQQKAQQRFASPEFQNIFKKAGTKIISLSTKAKIGIMNTESIKLLNNLLK